MSEAQNLGINLDAKSVQILKKIDASFRDTVVNIGLRMVENTELFNTLAGTSKDISVEDMVSLDQLDDEDDTPKVKKSSRKSSKVQEELPIKKAPVSSGWDTF